LQSALREFISQGHKVCALEASSIGIEEARLNGTAIRVAVFTNLTQDHLDYHATMHAYGQAKKRLFAWQGLRCAVINTDDAFGADLEQSLAATSPDIDIWTVALTASARLVARHIVATPPGLQFEVIEDGQSITVKSHIMGEYNVANMLSVIASMRSLGVDLPSAIAACSQLRAVPGRMECLGGDDAPLVVVDYAHTPDALQQALQALRPAAQQRGGDLWCVFGCGGDRDTTKRPFMGAVATAQADKIIVTSDNPRSERPLSIIENILAGVSRSDRLAVQVDRALAIASAVGQASNEDVILLAGKGHEATQEIAGVKSYFSDRDHASTALRQRAQDRRSVHA
jgi:UDP-N-acetylmuramoyl-L-alanyl-D-glutamate--2,6-diaminopimelate ligase